MNVIIITLRSVRIYKRVLVIHGTPAASVTIYLRPPTWQLRTPLTNTFTVGPPDALAAARPKRTEVVITMYVGAHICYRGRLARRSANLGADVIEATYRTACHNLFAEGVAQLLLWT